MMTHNRPSAGEYAPYFEKYVALVKAPDVLGLLEAQSRELQGLLSPLSEAQGGSRYAPDKWTIKESLGHVVDAERVFSYRALRIARGDQTPLASFDQDGFVKAGNFDARSLADLLDEHAAVRRASLALYRSFAEEAWDRRGVASTKEITVRALIYITAGHELHHLNLFRDKYLPALPKS